MLTYLLACLLAYLLTCLLTHSLTHSLTYLLTYLLTYSLAYLLTCLLTHLRPEVAILRERSPSVIELDTGAEVVTRLVHGVGKVGVDAGEQRMVLPDDLSK